MEAPELAAKEVPQAAGTFLDMAAFQRDALVRREMLSDVDVSVFEHRQHALVVPDRQPLTGGVRTAPEGDDWTSYLLKLDAAGDRGRGVRCVRVAPLAPAVQDEVHMLGDAGVAVRVVDVTSAARSRLPEILVLGDCCAYVLGRRDGALVGAVHVNDPRRVRRWAGALWRLYGCETPPNASGR